MGGKEEGAQSLKHLNQDNIAIYFTFSYLEYL